MYVFIYCLILLSIYYYYIEIMELQRIGKVLGIEMKAFV